MSRNFWRISHISVLLIGLVSRAKVVLCNAILLHHRLHFTGFIIIKLILRPFGNICKVFRLVL